MSEAFLHVANGHSTTGTIREAGIPGLLSIWADPLHEGPVPGDISDEELIDVRASHLALNCLRAPRRRTSLTSSGSGALKSKTMTRTASWCCGSSTTSSIS